MKLKNENILMFSRTMGVGGTEKVVLQLCEILKPNVNKIVVCSSGGVNESKLRSLGIKHYKIPDVTNRSLFNFIKIIISLRRIIKNENINIMHTHHRMAAFYTKIIAGKKIKRVVHAHNTFFDKKKFTKFSYSGAKIIAVGDEVKNNLVHYFEIPSKNITVIHNAINNFSNEIVKVSQLSNDKKNGNFLVGNVGRLSEQKGQEYFIKAAYEVLKKDVNFVFYIIGVGEDEKKLKKIVTELQIDNKIIFLGYRDDVQNIMSQLDLVVLSSLWEGLPLTPLEAFSVGTPVIATKIDGNTEIIKNRQNGLLVKPRESKSLASAILELKNNSSLSSRIVNNERMDFSNKYSFDKYVKRVVFFYKNI